MAIDPKIHFGRSCVAGRRIPVEDVLELIWGNIPFGEIIKFGARGPVPICYLP